VVDALLELLQARFGPVPEEVENKIRACKGVVKLRGWNVKAGTAASLEQFREVTGLSPPATRRHRAGRVSGPSRQPRAAAGP
jgi:hypothetical protein